MLELSERHARNRIDILTGEAELHPLLNEWQQLIQRPGPIVSEVQYLCGRDQSVTVSIELFEGVPGGALRLKSSDYFFSGVWNPGTHGTDQARDARADACKHLSPPLVGLWIGSPNYRIIRLVNAAIFTGGDSGGGGYAARDEALALFAQFDRVVIPAFLLLQTERIKRSGINSMLAEVIFLRLADLFQVVAGTSLVVSLPDLLYRGYQQGNEYCDDRDNDEHFYEREPTLVRSRNRSGQVVFHDALLSFGIAFLILIFMGLHSPLQFWFGLFAPTGRDYNRLAIFVMTRA